VIAKHQEGEGHQSEAGNGERDNPGREIFENFQKGDHRACIEDSSRGNPAHWTRNSRQPVASHIRDKRVTLSPAA
jgi:hypothetical protein